MVALVAEMTRTATSRTSSTLSTGSDMGVLDPSEYIPDTVPTGPMQAANGQFGALQRAAGSSPHRQQVFGDDETGAIQRALIGRLRSPEDIERAKAERRGALDALKQARQQAPDEGWNWYTHYSLGASAADPELDIIGANRAGITQAMKASLAKKGISREVGIENASDELKFLTDEDAAAGREEDKALVESSKLLGKQISRKDQHHTKDGWYDLSSGFPVLIRPSNKDYTRVYESISRQAGQDARALNERGAFSTVEQYNAYVQNRIQQGMNRIMNDESFRAQIMEGAEQIPVGEQAAPEGAPTSGSGLQVTPESGITPPQTATVPPQQAPARIPLPNEPNLGTIDPAVQQGRDGEALRLLTAEREQMAAEGASPEDMAAIDREIAAMAPKAAPVVPEAAPAVVPTPTAQVPSVGATPLKSKAELAREKTLSVGAEKAGLKLLDEWVNRAQSADNYLRTYDQVRSLRANFDPGKLAGFKQTLGEWGGAVGMKGPMVRQAAMMQQARRLIQEQINDRMQLEKGVQTEGDAERFQRAYPSIENTPWGFDFGMNSLREIAMRNKARADFAQKYVESNGTAAGLDRAWDKHMHDNIGAMVLEDVGPNGEPMVRVQWIEETIAKTMESNPDYDEAEVREEAEQDWLRRSQAVYSKRAR
jgi:hypothetical protein